MSIPRRQRILLLESRPGRREILQEVLSREFVVELTSTVAEAAVKLRSSGPGFDLVVSALQVQTGESVFDLLNESNQRGVPLVFCCLFPSHLTVTLRDSMLTVAKLLGAREVLLQDQVDADALLKVVFSVLAVTPPVRVGDTS